MKCEVWEVCNVQCTGVQATIDDISLRPVARGELGDLSL